MTVPPSQPKVPAKTERPAKCSEERVREQLHRILTSPDFEASERNRRFLRYVVEEVLAGRAGRIKAYSIATTVFGRDSSFDPQVDAIVRIEARRLRQSLERYYLTGGRGDSLRITIPKGSYGAAFDLVAAGRHDPDGLPRFHGMRQSPAILVTPFHAAAPQLAEFAESLTRHIIINLTRCSDLVVFGLQPPGTIRGQATCDYALTGNAAMSGERLEVDAMLVEAETGRHLWAASLAQPVAAPDLAPLRDDIADRIVRTLAEPFGVILCARAQAEDAVALFYRHWRSSDREAQRMVEARLEELVASDDECSEALACLSLCLFDDIEHNSARHDYADQATHALALALRAIAVSPQSCRAHHALSLGYWHCADLRGCFDELREAIRLNSNDTWALAELGLRHALLGQWEVAVPILTEACSRCPRLPSGYRLGLSLFHYLHGRHEDALTEIRKEGAPHAPLGCALEAAAAGRLGRHEEARQAVDRLFESGGLAPRNMPTVMLENILEGCAWTGMPSPGARQLK